MADLYSFSKQKMSTQLIPKSKDTILHDAENKINSDIVNEVSEINGYFFFF